MMNPASCAHCSLPLPADGGVRGDTQAYCCHGCLQVAKWIIDTGLSGFYDRRGEASALAPPPEHNPHLSQYDLDAVQMGLGVTLTPIREVHLLVDGMHCAACIWLIEKALAKCDGVLSATANLTRKSVRIQWEHDTVALSTILAYLERYGFACLPDTEDAEAKRDKTQNRKLLYRLGFAGFAMMNQLWIAIALYTGAAHGQFTLLFHNIGFALATPTVFYSAWPFLAESLRSLRLGRLSMAVPVSLGALVTYAYSVHSLFVLKGAAPIYFDTVINFIFVLLIGRYIEALARSRAVADCRRTGASVPQVAMKLTEAGMQTTALAEINIGDCIRILPGEVIPLDGDVVDGASDVDESLLTGESHPQHKSVGERVLSGTLNHSHALSVAVTATWQQSFLQQLSGQAAAALSEKSPLQSITDRIAPGFVLTTLLLSTMTFIYWHGVSFDKAMMASLSVLIITCPCALALATPMSMAVACGRAYARGLLVKTPRVLETLAQAKRFVFDKTGTLTEGEMTLTRVEAVGDVSEEDLLQYAASLEAHALHPIAKALARAAEKTVPVAEVQVLPGLGVLGMIHGECFVVGNPRLLEQQGINIPATLASEINYRGTLGETIVLCAYHGVVAGFIALSDTPKVGAALMLAQLRQAGLKLLLLTGDKTNHASFVAEKLGGLPVIAEVLPEEKAEVLRGLQQDGPLVMVGDGVNDAVALATADVGIAMGTGADLAMTSAEVVCLNRDVATIGFAYRLAQRTMRVVYQNLTLSLLYNASLVPLAMAGKVTPLFAAIAMPVSSLLVIANANRLRSVE